MLVEPFSRFFLRHHVTFRTPHGHGVPLPLRSVDHLDVLDVLDDAIKNGRASYSLKNRDVISLTRMRLFPEHNLAVMLFRRSDPDAATPIFENARTKKLRRADKGPDDAVAVSAHLFIHTGGVPDAVNPRYHAILEEVHGLSRTYVHLLLQNILRSATYAYTDRHGEPKETYSIVEFQGVPSEKISGALKGDSVVSFVTLVRPGNIQGLDVEGLVKPHDQRMRLDLRATPEQTIGVIAKIQAWMGHHDWPHMLVEMSLPEDRKRIVAIAREADASDVLFVRSVPVNVANPLEVCTDEISEELCSKARELFTADGLA